MHEHRRARQREDTLNSRQRASDLEIIVVLRWSLVVVVQIGRERKSISSRLDIPWSEMFFASAAARILSLLFHFVVVVKSAVVVVVVGVDVIIILLFLAASCLSELRNDRNDMKAR